MATGRDAAAHAGRLYRRAFARLRLRALEAEAHHLREVEQAGESGETPFIAALGVALFLFPLFLFLVGVSFAAYYIAR